MPQQQRKKRKKKRVACNRKHMGCGTDDSRVTIAADRPGGCAPEPEPEPAAPKPAATIRQSKHASAWAFARAMAQVESRRGRDKKTLMDGLTDHLAVFHCHAGSSG